MKVSTHKHRGYRWTVYVHLDWKNDEEDPVFAWLTENFGEEDFENGNWARLSDFSDRVIYDITDRRVIAMLTLKWT